MLNHNYIGTEHELLALLQEREGVAGRALQAVGVTIEDARRQIEEVIGKGETLPKGHIPFTPRAKKVLELALREARQLGHHSIGTEHILLGMIQEGAGVGVQVLGKLGAEPEHLRQMVMQLLVGYTGGGEVSAPSEVDVGTIQGSGPRCPSCDLPLEDALRFRRLLAQPADEDDDPVPVTLFFCGRCGVPSHAAPIR